MSTNHTTEFDADAPVPALTADVVAAIADHRRRAQNVGPYTAEEGDTERWHAGEELLIRIDPATVRMIRNSTGAVPLLYVTSLHTDDEGDLILTGKVPA